ncbi:hypothetical protein A4H97_18200 [Niastella yeongjuensis]|uniref:Short-chain dehydrogenase n=1 Tax=Niastella yeongjuensis TaxID=354355 RepID=A0A1V9DXP8_9BACT|nr:hypothetical protein [Niastella yeongjuensis]OQP38653.1 hypothetical protein A4H97_18200 [Niastella yeongjuensis]SEO37909.1 hypothetical protein SAMN05660816_02763 [Niastella yeongjuensis]
MNSQQEKLPKTIVITGASSGVGKAMAWELAQQKNRLVLAAPSSSHFLSRIGSLYQIGSRRIKALL